LKKEISERKAQTESLIESAKASLDVFQAQINDIQKESFEFRKNVVVEGVNDQTKKVMAERVLLYFDNSFKEKSNLASSLQAKHVALEQRQKRLIQLDVKSKEGGFFFFFY
jgi:cytochrome c-type biogenesis protein CcmE